MRYMWVGIVLMFAPWAQAREGVYDWAKARVLGDGIAYAH